MHIVLQIYSFTNIKQNTVQQLLVCTLANSAVFIRQHLKYYPTTFSITNVHFSAVHESVFFLLIITRKKTTDLLRYKLNSYIHVEII
jgi:hypothetical protein